MKALAIALIALLLASCAPAIRFARPGRTGGKAPREKPRGRASDVEINRSKMMAAINKYRGVPYKWGGMSRKGMDCSGFVKTVFWEAERIGLPRNSREQSQYGRKVRASRLRFGDLVFFKIKSFRINHVGIFIGRGRFAHASWTLGVTVTGMDDPYYKDKFVMGKRLYYE
jgi:cell wall-associated NlpC family hydrolase